MRNTLTAALRAIRNKIRGEQQLDAQVQQIADRMVEELRAAVVDLQETREDIRELAKQWVSSGKVAAGELCPAVAWLSCAVSETSGSRT